MTEFKETEAPRNPKEEHLPEFLRANPAPVGATTATSTASAGSGAIPTTVLEPAGGPETSGDAPDAGASEPTFVMVLNDPDSGESPHPGRASQPPTEPGNPAGKRRWLLPVITIGLALLAIACLGLALIAPSLFPTDNTPERVAPTEVDAPIHASSDDDESSADDDSGSSSAVSISELADPAWVARTASAAGIPERAMTAYAGAAVYAQDEFPGCGLGWNTLAAIGQVESEHGTLGGSSIGRDGVAAPSIIGIPLDGTTTQQIPDTDQGELDGDTTWDRAVGPMQFLPSTWAHYAIDGNGDGEKDPHHIDDAALSAAAYLCALGGDLTQPENWIAAIDAYNPSVDYNNRVAEAANQYASM